ncbi:30S ribosomal protein S4 [Truepera radiovictrix]|uniref:Small ribosomal subunit protein uS4 n=1 Tax=Truepera radiovictrix (strain DSM 17093 / CIP 108686 / LMG 22925 / RQ-24) TaxID=649638 RepID=D7CVG4_TRURR|nr:30S ribosomal protein S4 [Truepera radiovictrix]ADI14192.1 ribosomal protein S4 [Truepera radiovictrix DSM 17093]WMT57250.1 30S ribosomal protein S4 [Truepera radiovictrix]
MGRQRDPIVKLSRREGVNLAETPKVQKYMERRPYPPGQHGQRRSRKLSDYGVRLREKQKLRRLYNLSEKQFSNLFAEAVRQQGATGGVFLQLLESRLDNVVFRLGIAHTRRQARQFVTHRHILVNGKVVDVPSYRVRPGDEIAVAPRSRSNEVIKSNVEARKRGRLSPWLEFDSESLKGKFQRLPSREDITVPVNELQVIEYYSR